MRHPEACDAAMLSLSGWIAAFVVFSSLLIKLGLFSVNRSLMLLAVLAFVYAAAAMFIKRIWKPSFTVDMQNHIIVLLIALCFAVIYAGVFSDGFFGMDNVIGASQAKAINLSSANEISPLDADYLSSLPSEALDRVQELNSGLRQQYDGYSPVLAALFSMGAYFFGYANMMDILIVPAICLIYVVYRLLAGLHSRFIQNAGALSAAVLLCIGVTVFFGRNVPTKWCWNTLQELQKMISSYDVVILDDTATDYYVPLACATRAKAYPDYDSLDKVAADVKANGERLYYLTRADIDTKALEKNGLYLKKVYHNSGTTLYRFLNFYKTRQTFDYFFAKRAVCVLLFMAGAAACLIMVFASVFRDFDNAVNMMLAVALTLGLYALLSAFLVQLNLYSILYAAAVTFALCACAAGLVYYYGGRPRYRYQSYKSLGLIFAFVVITGIALRYICGDLYASYRTLGSSQLWALKYIYNSAADMGTIRNIPLLSSVMALIGSIFGAEKMLLTVPLFVISVVTLLFTAVERAVYQSRYREKWYIGLNTAAAVCSVAAIVLMSHNIYQKATVAKWDTLQQYADAIEPDDALAIQRSVYNVYRLPLEIMTGTRNCFKAVDKEQAARLLGNNGKDTYYLTYENVDMTYERVSAVVHVDRNYLYRTYDYLTKRGIYSVNDSVTKGFYSADSSGMAWTSNQNAFIQVNLPYRGYDTLRVYLGDRIKLDEINLDYIELEFRENWYKADVKRIDRDNNGTYVDFILDWSYMVPGNNVLYFHSSVMWSPLIYGSRDTRVMGFPFLYMQFLALNEEDVLEE